MHHKMLNLAQAAAQAHVEPNELKHCAQRGEIAAQKRGDDFFFSAADVLEWAQRNLLCESRKALAASHREMNDARRRRTVALELASLIPVDAVDLAVPAKTKAGMIRDMADLAVKSGWVYDVEGLFAALLAREEAASTAVGEGAAFLHPQRHDPYFFERTFIAYGRAVRPVFFGAPDGGATRHFFVICATGQEEHLHILARLAVLAHGSDLLEQLDAAETSEEVLAAFRAAEAVYCT
mgnify:FL=1